ncbi:thioredoxin [Candidatus Woesearchaeota archaeon]|nr:thioredoxin [Candidatus Woesearchaeota archaeon]
MAPERLTDADFDGFIAGGSPSVVDFWAGWCGPCQILGPIFEDVSKGYGPSELRFGKLDVDASSATAARFDVMSIPTLVLFKDGKEAGRLVGFMGKEQLKGRLDEFLARQRK